MGTKTFAGRVAEELRRDGLIYLLIGGQITAAVLLGFLLGHPEKVFVGETTWRWLPYQVSAGIWYVVLFEIGGSIRANPAEPLARLRSRLPVICSPRVVAGVLLMLVVAASMGAFTSVKNLLQDLTQFSWDVRFADLDAALHGGDPWRLVHPLLGWRPLHGFLQTIYLQGWLMTCSVMAGVYAVSPKLDGLRLRFFLTYLFCWIVLGNVLAGLFMSAGPAFYGQVTGDHVRFAEALRYLSLDAARPDSAFAIQQRLWGLHVNGQAEIGTGISAFPSLHVAMATLVALGSWRINRAVGWAGTAFLAIIMAESVHLGWHYAVDGYASIILTSAAWFGIGWALRPHERTARSPQMATEPA